MGAIRSELVRAGFCYRRNIQGGEQAGSGATAPFVFPPGWGAGWRGYSGFRLGTPDGGNGAGTNIQIPAITLNRPGHGPGEKALVPYHATYTYAGSGRDTETNPSPWSAFTAYLSYPGILLGGWGSFLGAQDLAGYEVQWYPDQASPSAVVINYFPAAGQLATLWAGQMALAAPGQPPGYFWANPDFYGMQAQVIFRVGGSLELNFDHYQGGCWIPYQIASGEPFTGAPTVTVTATFDPPTPAVGVQADYAIGNGSTDSFLICGGVAVNVPPAPAVDGLPDQQPGLLAGGGGSRYTAPGSFAAIRYRGPGALPAARGLNWYYQDNTDPNFYGPLCDGRAHDVTANSNVGVPGRYLFTVTEPALRLGQRDDNLGPQGSARILSSGTNQATSVQGVRAPRLGQTYP